MIMMTIGESLVIHTDTVEDSIWSKERYCGGGEHIRGDTEMHPRNVHSVLRTYCRCIVHPYSDQTVDNLQRFGWTPESALAPDSVALKNVMYTKDGSISEMYIRVRTRA
jgi:hypothetical protein